MVVSSNDEFMMMEWTSLWWEKMAGEKYLLVNPNTEHSTLTNIPKTMNTVSWFVDRIKYNRTEIHSFDSQFDDETATIQVQMHEGAVKPFEVALRHTETLSSKKRDFRWVGVTDENGNCEFPAFKVPTKEGLCVQPMFWEKDASHELGSGKYKATVPSPRVEGHWKGAFAEVIFPFHHPSGHWLVDFIVNPNEFSLTSPGFVTPNTFPFEDCHLETCTNTSA